MHSRRSAAKLAGDGSGAPGGSSAAQLIPRWDEVRRELAVDGQIVKRFRLPAPNQEAVLAAFEEEGWPPRVFDPEYTQEPVQDGERTVTLRRVGDSQLISALYHITPGASPDFAAMDLLEAIMSDTPTGRLHKALVETKLAAGVYGYTMSTKQPGIVLWGAKVRAEASLDAAREALLKTLEGAANQPITADEVEQARTRWLKQFDEVMNDPEQLGVALSESIALGDWRLLFVQRDRVRKVTVAEVQFAATQFLKPANLSLPTSRTARRCPGSPGLLRWATTTRAILPPPRVRHSTPVRTTLTKGQRCSHCPME